MGVVPLAGVEARVVGEVCHQRDSTGTLLDGPDINAPASSTVPGSLAPNALSLPFFDRFATYNSAVARELLSAGSLRCRDPPMDDGSKTECILDIMKSRHSRGAEIGGTAPSSS